MQLDSPIFCLIASYAQINLPMKKGIFWVVVHRELSESV